MSKLEPLVQRIIEQAETDEISVELQQEVVDFMADEKRHWDLCQYLTMALIPKRYNEKTVWKAYNFLSDCFIDLVERLDEGH